MTLPDDRLPAGQSPSPDEPYPAPVWSAPQSPEPEQEPEPSRRRRPGRPRLTPLRVTLAIALIGSMLVVAYGLIARDATQIPVLTAGEFITGIVFGLLALAGAWAAFSRARGGESGKALLYAMLGGIAALLAAGAFAGAVIQALILGG